MLSNLRGLFGRPKTPQAAQTYQEQIAKGLMQNAQPTMPSMPALQQQYGPGMMEGFFTPPILEASVETPEFDPGDMTPGVDNQQTQPSTPQVDGTPDAQPNATGLMQRWQPNEGSEDRARARREALTSYDEMSDQELLDYAAGFGTDEMVNLGRRMGPGGMFGLGFGALDDWNLRATMSNRFGEQFDTVDDAVSYAQRAGGQARELNPVDKFIGGVRSSVDNIFKPVRDAVSNVKGAVEDQFDGPNNISAREARQMAQEQSPWRNGDEHRDRQRDRHRGNQTQRARESRSRDIADRMSRDHRNSPY